MIVIGASGHASVIIEIMEVLEIPVELIYDADESKGQLLSYNVSHSTDFIGTSSEQVIAIGNNRVRKLLAERFKGPFAKALIHPSAIISETAVIGKGTVVMPGAIVNANARIGNHVIINSGVVIEHDCVIEDYVHISPNAALAGNVTVNNGSQVGIGASVVQGVIIGANSMIGAGAAVTTNIPENCTAVGVPAKPIKFHESAKN